MQVGVVSRSGAHLQAALRNLDAPADASALVSEGELADDITGLLSVGAT
ncbi:MAG: hypothetical protein ABI468_06465 [Candidatus Nanopelagicales bacterium]